MGLWTTRGKKVWRMRWWRRKRLSRCLACLVSSLWSSWSTWDAAWLEFRSQTFTSRRLARFATFYDKKILLKIILKVGSFFFGNGTTFSDEVRFIAKVFRYFTSDVFFCRRFSITKNARTEKRSFSPDLRQSHKWNISGRAGRGAEGDDHIALIDNFEQIQSGWKDICVSLCCNNNSNV